jgi:hypothetical protein
MKEASTVSKDAKCPLCFGTGKIKSSANEGWETFLKHNKDYMLGFQNGYDKCNSDDRSAILSKAMHTAEPYQEQLTRLFTKLAKGTKKKISAEEETKIKEYANFMADIVCMELGLNKNIKG